MRNLIKSKVDILAVHWDGESVLRPSDVDGVWSRNCQRPFSQIQSARGSSTASDPEGFHASPNRSVSSQRSEKGRGH
mgnify:CR=1 FL=1